MGKGGERDTEVVRKRAGEEVATLEVEKRYGIKKKEEKRGRRRTTNDDAGNLVGRSDGWMGWMDGWMDDVSKKIARSSYRTAIPDVSKRARKSRAKMGWNSDMDARFHSTGLINQCNIETDSYLHIRKYF